MTDRELYDILKAMSDLALIERTHFTELLRQGFKPKEALILTSDFISACIKQPEQKQSPSPFNRLGNLM